MKKYEAKNDVIFDLHEKGYCEDFQLLGNDLYWVQEKQIVRVGDFIIGEYHRFFAKKSRAQNLIMIGIVTTYSKIKGILMIQRKFGRFKFPPIIHKKLNEISADSEVETFSRTLIYTN